MTTEIGKLSVRIDADTAGLQRGTRQGEQRLRQFSGSMERTTAIARRLSGVLGAIGIGVGFAQAIREISNFQAAMNGLAAVSGATADQMGKLESQARSLGATSQFSAQQAAEAQRFLAQAGFEVNEVLGATPGILKLAMAGQLDLASAADIASNVLGGMRLEVGELNRVNDVLAATASRSNTNIQQLGQALSFAAPFAAGAGISIEEAAAAIGNMSDAGIQASRAGTGLVGVIRQLSNVTSGGEAVLAKYGLSMAQVDISARGLGPVLETLRAANLNTTDSLALFGSEAGAAAQVLVNDYSGAIQDAAGESDRMAAILDRGLGPAFKSLQSAVSESVLQMGDSGLAGALENLIRTSTGVISVFNGMEREWAEANGVGEGTLTMVKAIATTMEALAVVITARLTVALGRYVGAQIAANAAMVTGAGAARALAGAMALAGGPLGLLVGAGGLLYAFRDELGLVAGQAGLSADEIDRLTGEANELSQEARNNQIGELSKALEEATLMAATAREELAKLRNDNRGSGPLGFGAGEVGAEVRGMQAVADAQERILEIRQRLGALRSPDFKPLDDWMMRGQDGSTAPTDPNAPSGAGSSTSTDAEKEAEKRAKERSRLREHLEQRLQIIRESLMSEQELEAEQHAQKMETLAEIRENELVTDEEFRQLKEEAEAQHLERIRAMEQRTADERAKIEKRHADTIVGMRQNVVQQSIALLDMFAGESKVAALASIALQKGLAIAQTIMNTQVAQMRAMAELGPIAGPPAAAAIGAMGAISTGIIAAQGLAQAASAMGGGGSSSVSSAVGGSANQPNQSQQQGQQEAAPVGGTLTVQGISSSALFTGDAVRELAEELINYQKRGGTITIE